MSILMGKEGYIYTAIASGTTATSIIAAIDTWTLDSGVDIIDVTAFTGSTVTHKSGMPALKQSSGSISGSFDGSCLHAVYLLNTLTASTVESVKMAFYANASHYFSASFNISRISLGVPVADKITFSCDIVSTGAVAWNLS